MYDAIAVTLEGPAHGHLWLFMNSSTTVVVERSVGFQLVHGVLPLGKCSVIAYWKHLTVLFTPRFGTLRAFP
jgi:hypothetical protein